MAWKHIEGLPGEWWHPEPKPPLKERVASAFAAADKRTVKILGSMLRSVRAYAKRIDDEAGGGT
jgi:hypothetical protein